MMSRRGPGIAIGAAVILLAMTACTSGSAESSTAASAAPAAGTSAASSASGGASSSASGTAGAAGVTPSSGTGRIEAIPGLDQSAIDVMNKDPYASGIWAIAVQDMDSGEQIVSYNASSLFEPGSVVKTYSTGAAWHKFGPDSTVVTPVKRTGEVVDGTLTGDLVLVGQGDLTMGGRTKADGTVDFTNLDHNDANGIPGATLTTEDPLTGLNELAAQVKAAGITSVSGDVIVDNRLWDEHELVGDPITPMVINQNVIDLTTTATTPGQPATSEMSPKVAPWTVDVQVQTIAAGETDQGIKVTSPGAGQILLTGTILADSAPVLKVYVLPDPATFARTALIEALGRAGVTVTADPVATNPEAALPATDAVDGLTSVAELTSLSLDQEVTYVNKISYNRGAEALICRLAVSAGSTMCDAGLPEAQKIWAAAGLDTTGATLIDGSGLAGNLITADNQVQLQTIMAQRPDAAGWKATLPILGVDGSLTTVQPDSPAKGKVSGKTGTLLGQDEFNPGPTGGPRFRLPTKALGGYIDTAGGRHFAFAVMATNSVFDDLAGVFAANDDVGAVVASIQENY